MALINQSQQGIGRGEPAESRVETPFFAVFMLLCAVLLFVFHFYVKNPSYTIAAAVSMLAFGATIVRVHVGLYILVTAMLLSPEIEAGSVGAAGERGVNLRYDDILIGIIFFGVLVKLAFEGRSNVWRSNPINVGIFAYYLICILSTLNAWRMSVGAWDRNVAFFVMLKMAEFYMVFFMVTLAVSNLRDIRRQLTVFMTVAVMICIYALSTLGTVDRVSAPFEAGGTEPNTLGGYLIIVMCLATGLMLYAPRKSWRMGFGLIAILSFLPFLMTLSRASYISLIVAFAVLGIMSRRKYIIVTLVLVLVLSPFLMPEDVKDRVNGTFQRGSGQPISIAGRDTGIQVDKSTYERIYVWQKVRYNLRVWPLLGGGVSWETVLDSQYARVLIETGVLGFAAFVFLLFRILKTTRESFRWSRDWVAKGLSLGMCATAAGLIVHGMGTISFLIVRIMEPFWFLLALTVVARQYALREHAWRLQQERAALETSAAAASDELSPQMVHSG